MVMTGPGGAYNDHRVVAVMPMPGTLAVVVKCDPVMMPMMETLTVLVDYHVVILVHVGVLVVGPDNNVSLSRGRHCRHGKGQRQSAQNQKFHGKFSKGLSALRHNNSGRMHSFLACVNLARKGKAILWSPRPSDSGTAKVGDRRLHARPVLSTTRGAPVHLLK